VPRTTTLAFEIQRSRIQGRGAFAIPPHPGRAAHHRVRGERISQEEGDRRYVENGMRRHHTFPLHARRRDADRRKRGGNASRYINHSCDPNCEAIIEDGRIYIHAKKNIQPGTELTYDYQYERTAAHTEEDERFYACLCGSPKCRGTILAPKKRRRRRA
jgi:SET domain-containing protein